MLIGEGDKVTRMSDNILLNTKKVLFKISYLHRDRRLSTQ